MNPLLHEQEKTEGDFLLPLEMTAQKRFSAACEGGLYEKQDGERGHRGNRAPRNQQAYSSRRMALIATGVSTS